jgi:4-hydroxybenzoate polyprenyltransferase
MSKPKTLKTDFRPLDRWLVIALNLGPLSALTNLMVSYVLAEESCLRGSKLILHVTAGVFFALALAGGAIAWRVAQKIGDAEIDALHERTRWLASAAIVLAIASAVLIVAMEIPNLILRSCD